MATRFSPLKIDKKSLFGVRLSGSVGRHDKKRVQELAGKCLKNGKTRVILDLTELDNIGGGAASVLAEFQRQLVELSGEVVFAGVKPISVRFLTQQFEDLPLRCYADAESAVLAYDNPESAPIEALPPKPSVKASSSEPKNVAGESPEAMGAVCLTDDVESGADSSLDSVLESFGDSEDDAPTPATRKKKSTTAPNKAAAPKKATAPKKAVAPKKEPAAAKKPPAAPKKVSADPRKAAKSAPQDTGKVKKSDTAKSSPAGEGKDPKRHAFLSLEDAVAALGSASNAEALCQPLSDLLHSNDLASEVISFVMRGDSLVAGEGEHSFSAGGTLAGCLVESVRPLSLLDVPDDELDEAETRLLAELQPDLMLPIVWQGKLATAAFLRRGGSEREYDVSENFALELLMKVARETIGRSEDTSDSKSPGTPRYAPAVSAAATEELARELHRSRQLLTTTAAFASCEQEQDLWAKAFAALQSEFGISSLGHLVITASGPRLQAQFGEGIDPLPAEIWKDAKVRTFMQRMTQPVSPRDLPAGAAKLRKAMQDGRADWLAPLQLAGQIPEFILVRLGADTPVGVDGDFLSDLLKQAVAAVGRLRSQNSGGDWQLDLMQKLVSTVESRIQGNGELTIELVHLVASLAGQSGLSAEEVKNVVYGALVRDIGMIPLGDLAMHAPQKLSNEQWARLKAHPEMGVKMLDPLDIPDSVKDVILYHHERFNGEGYPKGLEGADIPLSARIVAVVENYVSMTTDLPSRGALPKQRAKSILIENWGERYDPKLVLTLSRVLDRQSIPEELQEQGALEDLYART